MRSARSRLGALLDPPILLAIALAISTASCIPEGEGWIPSPRVTSIEERFELAEHSFLAVRHVKWTVTKGDPPFLDLRVDVRTGPISMTEVCQSQPIGVELRIVPDDDALTPPIAGRAGCQHVRIDLGEACEAGCSSGATVLLRYVAPPPDAHAKVTIPLIVLLSGRVNYGAGGTLELVGDPFPGQDLAPAVQSTGRVEIPFEIGPRSPDALHKLVLRVSADALQAPLVGLHGFMRIWVQQVDDKGGFATVQSVTVGTLEPYPPDAHGASNDVDWLRQCSPGVDCEIPLALDMRTVEGPSPSDGHTATVPDYYRWAVEVTLIALDGRSLPVDALRLDPN